MEKDTVIAILKEHRAELTGLGVTSLYLFGSTARGEARPDSDVDLFYDYERPLGLIELSKISMATSDLLGCKADVMPRDCILSSIRARVEASAVAIF